MTTAKAQGWEKPNHLDERYIRTFGPIKAVCLRSWDYKNPDPSHYYGYFEGINTPEAEFVVTIAETGEDWFEDRCARVALRLMAKKMKAVIRGWAK